MLNVRYLKNVLYTEQNYRITVLSIFLNCDKDLHCFAESGTLLPGNWFFPKLSSSHLEVYNIEFIVLLVL